MPRKSNNNRSLAVGLAITTWFVGGKASAISLDDIQLWAGSGANRAALVMEWSVPESLTNSSVPAPVADKTLVWGYRFNGAATGAQMLQAILAADPKLYVIATETNGVLVEGIGYNLNGNGVIGVTDGASANLITNGLLTNATVNLDSAHAINSGDLYWSGVAGPKWELWNETNDAGGFWSSPNRGADTYWTPTDTVGFSAGYHGQWVLAQSGLDSLQLANGSWIGFSVAAGEYEPSPSAPCNLHKHAPPSPDGAYVAYVCDTNDFAVQIVSANNLDPASPYNDPTAALNRPTLSFLDVDDFDEDVTDRVKIIEPPYNTTANGGDVITEISTGGQIIVKLGRSVYHDPDNPYGVDFIVYGNSLFPAISGGSGPVSDETDLGLEMFTSSAISGHPNLISVSQDGVNWFTYPASPCFFPDNAYRWDDTNSSWTDEEMNPTKPLNPYVYTNDFTGQSVASALDQFAGASGGTGYSLEPSGFPWIQYVSVQAETNLGQYTVLDAIAAVNPVVVGDALSIGPDNLASGITRLSFQEPSNPGQNQISIDFSSVNESARISTVSLHDFSSFAPVEGAVSAAYQIQSRPVMGAIPVSFAAAVSLRAGGNYSGSGNDLRVFQWNGANWLSQPFSFNPTNDEVSIASVTNFSAFAISQIVPPSLTIQSLKNGFAFQFTPVPNCPETLARSTDLAAWTPIRAFTATNAQPVTLQDSNPPPNRAFYRLQLNP